MSPSPEAATPYQSPDRIGVYLMHRGQLLDSFGFGLGLPAVHQMLVLPPPDILLDRFGLDQLMSEEKV